MGEVKRRIKFTSGSNGYHEYRIALVSTLPVNFDSQFLFSYNFLFFIAAAVVVDFFYKFRL